MSPRTDLAPSDWRALFERSGCVMLLTDESFVIVRANAAASRVLGRPMSQLAGSSIDEFIVWPSHEARVTERRNLVKDGTICIKRRFVVAQGGFVDLDVCGTASILPGLHMFVAMPPVRLRDPKPEARGNSLSRRELQVVDLLANGLTGEEAAEHLVLSPHTVRTHIRNAMDKLGARTRAHLVAIRMRDDLS